ncbi:dimethylglycine demethylation protein DgcA [Streptomyces hawaiiensis]|uniref:oxidoreductase n=1 Tax=Streptomyces hawaiiensis TaxID=67305 RepID=UPI0031DB5D42
MSRLTHLTSPFQLGKLTVRNRIVSTPHTTRFPRDGYITDDYIDYYREKARGGVGLLQCFGSMTVHPSSPYQDWGTVKNWDDSSLPTFEKFAEEMHRWGAKVMAQITHRGRRGNGTVTEQALVAPSPVYERVSRTVPRALRADEIREIVAAYAAAAVRLQRAGFDGVEVSGYARHLIDQFWSPEINQRDDEYGGSFVNRMRFGVEVIESVREAVGSDFTVGLRISGDELIPGGRGIEGAKEIVAYLDQLGCLDYFSVAGATGEPVSIGHRVIPAFDAPQGVYAQYAAEVRKATDRPVLYTGRVSDPEFADSLIAHGICDLVGMTRALIADPHLPNKVAADALQEVKPCVAMQQGCVGRGPQGLYTGCTHNPVIGREKELRDTAPARTTRRVLVIGGGPGGLEAARVASSRGHQVTLLEARPFLGGRVAISSRAPMRPEWGQSIDWLVRQAHKTGVEVRTGVEADAAVVAELQPDAVVVATGSTPHLPQLPGTDLPGVTTAEGVFAHPPQLTTPASCLVVDLIGNAEAGLAAHALAVAGHRVRILTPYHMIAEMEEKSTREPVYDNLCRAGVDIITDHDVVAVRPGDSLTVELEQVYTRGASSIEGLELVVFSDGARPRDGLYQELKTGPWETHLVGDAVAPRGILEAMLEATRVARGL